MGIKSISLMAVALVLSTSVNAVVLNTLNDVDYEWLEITETQGLSRIVVESRLVDVNDELYGYEYASRQLVEDLFLSYTPWDGLNGSYGADVTVTGVQTHLADFGGTQTIPSDDPLDVFTTVDGYTVGFETFLVQNAFYGTIGECATATATCLSQISVAFDADGIATMAYLSNKVGYDADYYAPSITSTNVYDTAWGSYLVRTAVVPVPPAVWLFGSGLIGLIGVARRKKA